MSDPNTPEQPRYSPPAPQNLAPAPQPFAHPAAPLFPAPTPAPLLPAPVPVLTGPQPQFQPRQPVTQAPAFSTDGNPNLSPIVAEFAEVTPETGPSPVRPPKPGVRVASKPARNGGINTVSCVAAAAAVAGVGMALVPQVQFAAPIVSAIALTASVWGFTLPRFKRVQSIVAGAIAVAGVVAVAAISLIAGAAPVANGHKIVFEVSGSGATAASSVTWASDASTGSQTTTDKGATLPWKHSLEATGNAKEASYSVWLEEDKGKGLAAGADFTCAIFVDGIAVNRGKVADGMLACSYYGDLNHPENVDAKH